MMNDAEFQAKVAERVKQIAENGGFTSFDGDEYCEDCAGWDGVSHRCDCGNRRVSWADWYGMDINAEAH